MKIISWNGGGLGSSQVVRRLQHMLKMYNPQLVFFMENKLSKIQMEKVHRSCGFLNGINVSMMGLREGLFLVWRANVSISLKRYSSNHIEVEVENCDESLRWRLTGFYMSLNARNRQESWNLLCGLGHTQELLWLVCGEFNNIMYGFEKVKGVPRD